MKKALKGKNPLFIIYGVLALVVLALTAVLSMTAYSLIERQSRPHQEPLGNDAVTALPAPDPKSPGSSKASLPPTENVSPAFVQFMTDEARSMNAPSMDMEAAEARVVEQVSQMGFEEVEYARAIALSPEAPANQRILAAYLIASGGAKTRDAADDLVNREFDSKRAKPDTMEEKKNVDAKASALMVVDKTAKRAETDPSAREDLARWAAEAKDSTIKKYIEATLRRLPTL